MLSPAPAPNVVHSMDADLFSAMARGTRHSQRMWLAHKTDAMIAAYGGRSAQIIIDDMEYDMNKKEGLYNPVAYDKADLYQKLAPYIGVPTVQAEQPFALTELKIIPELPPAGTVAALRAKAKAAVSTFWRGWFS